MFNGKFVKISIIAALIFSFFVPALVQGAGLNQAASDINEPQVEIINTASDNIELIVRFPSNPIFESNEGLIFNEGLYEHPSEVGAPDLPVLRKAIKLPLANQYDLEIISSKSYTAQLGENGLPASLPQRSPEVEKSRPGQSEETAQEAAVFPEGSFPEAPVQLSQTFIVRGHQIAQLQLWPAMVQPDGVSVVIFSEIHFKIHIQQADLNLTLDRTTSHASPSFDRLLSDQVLNFDTGVSIESEGSKGNEPILVIAPDAFLTPLNALVNLKENQGHPVILVPLSVTGSTPESIKSYIKNAYENWTSPPTYLILVGDVNNGSLSMPAFTGLSSDTVTDLYYGTVDGDDWIPDIFVGRMPARNATQLNTMINNLAAYNNLTGGEGWVKKAAFLASNDSNYWDLAEATQNYVIQSHTQPKGYLGTFPSASQPGGDKLYSFSYNAGNTDVVNAINNRRALVTYTGHGSRTSWGGPSYSQTNIRSISHTGVFSVVTSFACDTGDFNITESFGETWLLQPNKGAVAFIGSSSSSFWGPDDTLERAMMDSLYSGDVGANIVGSFRFDGLMAVEASRPGTSTAQSRYYWESYNLLGDPSLAMLTGPKQSDFTLSANPSSISLCQGSNATTEVIVGQINGFSNPVSLSLSGLPSGVNGNYSLNPVIPAGTSTLTLTADSTPLTGGYNVKINGDSGGIHHEFSLGLQIFEGSPQTVNLSEPLHQADGVSATPTFTWAESQSNLTYQIQVAEDPQFSQRVINVSGLEQPSYTPVSSLENNHIYYWRVRASNPCGTSYFSPAFQFTTMAAPGTCPAGTSLSPVYQTKFETYPANWTHSGTNDSWKRTTTRAFSPGYSFHSVNQNEISLQNLTTPAINLPETTGSPITLAFWHWFEIESNASGCFDGALLEISTDGGAAWTPIPDSLLMSSKYTGIISSSYGNPMGGKQAWCGSRDWSETLVDLTAYAGQSIKLRFTQASDASLGMEGWYVDDFSISACEAIPEYRPRFNTNKVSVSNAPGEETTVILELTNAGLQSDTYTLNINSDGWGAMIKSQETFSLSPGETKAIEISVTIPSTAKPGQTEEILVSVVSTEDPDSPAAEDTAIIELKANLMSFIPLLTHP